MLLNFEALSILLLGNRKPDNESIQQRLSDGFHCPVFLIIHLQIQTIIKSVCHGGCSNGRRISCQAV